MKNTLTKTRLTLDVIIVACLLIGWNIGGAIIDHFKQQDYLKIQENHDEILKDLQCNLEPMASDSKATLSRYSADENGVTGLMLQDAQEGRTYMITCIIGNQKFYYTK